MTEKKEREDARRDTVYRADPSFKCESCEFFSDDEEYGPTCSLGLDEDEFAEFIERRTGSCPYYRYYDEYQTVRRQN